MAWRSNDQASVDFYYAGSLTGGTPQILLYLIRHAEAVERNEQGPARDFDRWLTPHGHSQALALAQAFLHRKLAFDAVVASPLVRAHQTAADLLAVWQPDARVVTCDHLAPDQFKPNKLSDFLAAVPGEAIAAVGHMPDLGAYAEWLIGAARGTIPFVKAGAACLEFRGHPGKAAGELHWLITPEWLA
jgi:phosphohistidine phosphatase